MKEIKYKCNLCHELIDPKAPDGAVGIYYRWEHGIKNWLVFRPLEEVSNHLCGGCKRGIAEGIKMDEQKGGSAL